MSFGLIVERSDDHLRDTCGPKWAKGLRKLKICDRFLAAAGRLSRPKPPKPSPVPTVRSGAPEGASEYLARAFAEHAARQGRARADRERRRIERARDREQLRIQHAQEKYRDPIKLRWWKN